MAIRSTADCRCGLVVRPDAPAGPTPVVVWAHGTTGWAPGCAPSLLDAPFEAGALLVLEDVVEQGWTLVAEHEDVASVVADRLNKVEGVTETETHIAFRTYSQHDLESAFSIGLD